MARLGGLSMAGVLWVGGPGPARACSYTTGPEHPPDTMPADGVIPIRVACQDLGGRTDCSDVAFDVADASGAPLTGVRSVMPMGPGDLVITWLPDASPLVGSTMLVSLEGWEEPFEVQVTEPLGDVSPFGTASFSLERVAISVGEAPLCCTDGAGCGSQCMGAQRRDLAILRMDWEWAVPSAEGEQQFIYRVVAEPTRDPTEEWAQPHNATGIRFEIAQETYCGTVEALRLSDGTTHRMESGCVDHGDLGELGLRPTTLAEAGAWLETAGCDDPPASPEAVLCQLGIGSCDDSPESPDADPIDTGGDGFPPDDSPTGGPNTRGVDAATNDGGCACTAAGASRRRVGATGGLGLLLGMLLVRRRREP